MPIELQEERFISAGATRMVAVSFAKWLDGLPGSPLLTGTPTVVEVSYWTTDPDVETVSTDLTLANKAINSSVLTINDREVVAGKAVQFSVSVPSDKAGRNYRVRITPTTDGVPAELEPHDIILRCV